MATKHKTRRKTGSNKEKEAGDVEIQQYEKKKFELYKISVETRNFEIGKFWERSNYMLILNTAIASGVLLVGTKSGVMLLAYCGVILSIVWSRLILGSKFWQARWEERLSKIEKQLFAGNAKLFATTFEEAKADVRDSFRFRDKKLLLRTNYSLRIILFPYDLIKWLINSVVDFLILLKFSVSKSLLLLCLLFAIFYLEVIFNAQNFVH